MDNNKKIIIRILGNDLDFIHGNNQTYDNLLFTLDNEPMFENTDKLFILNKIVNDEKKQKIIDLLTSRNIKYIDQIYNNDEVPLISNEDEQKIIYYIEKYKDNKTLRADEYKNLHDITNGINVTFIDINKCRNFCISYGKLNNYEWIFVLDSNSFFTDSLYYDIINNLDDKTEYIVIPQLRLQANGYKNNDIHNININKCKFFEPQLCFNIKSKYTFCEKLQYGRMNKGEFLNAIGVEGPWNSWNSAPSNVKKRTFDNVKYKTLSAVIRLFTYSTLNNINNNKFYRIVGLYELYKYNITKQYINNEFNIDLHTKIKHVDTYFSTIEKHSKNDKIIVRIISTPLDKNTSIQIYKNLEFTIKNEDAFIKTDKLFVLNKIQDKNLLGSIKVLLTSNDIKYIEITLDKTNIPHLNKDNEDKIKIFIDKYKYIKCTNKHDITSILSLTKEINNFFFGINKCRNFCIDYCKENGYEWFFILDSCLFFTNKQYNNIIDNINNNTQYITIPQIRLSDLKLFTPLRIENAQSASSLSLITTNEDGVLNEEKCNNYILNKINKSIQFKYGEDQIIFHKKSKHMFDEGIVYRNQDKKKLLNIIKKDSTKIQTLSSVYKLNAQVESSVYPGNNDNYFVFIENLYNLYIKYVNG